MPPTVSFTVSLWLIYLFLFLLSLAAAAVSFCCCCLLLLQALSLARFVQDPLAEAATLWGEGSDNLLLQLRLHPLQNAVNPKP